MFRISCLLFLLLLSGQAIASVTTHEIVTPENQYGREVEAEVSKETGLCTVRFVGRKGPHNFNRAFLFLTAEELKGGELFIEGFLHGRGSAPPNLLLITQIRPKIDLSGLEHPILELPEGHTYEISIDAEKAKTAYIYIGFPPGYHALHGRKTSIPLGPFCKKS